MAFALRFLLRYHPIWLTPFRHQTYSLLHLRTSAVFTHWCCNPANLLRAGRSCTARETFGGCLFCTFSVAARFLFPQFPTFNVPSLCCWWGDGWLFLTCYYSLLPFFCIPWKFWNGLTFWTWCGRLLLSYAPVFHVLLPVPVYGLCDFWTCRVGRRQDGACSFVCPQHAVLCLLGMLVDWCLGWR